MELNAGCSDSLEGSIQISQYDNQQMHLQLLESEKLETIGLLAASIAHEINNPIGFIHSNLSTLNDYLLDIFTVLDEVDSLFLMIGVRKENIRKIQELKKQKDLAYLRADISQLIAQSRESLLRVRNIVQDFKYFSQGEGRGWEWADLHKGLDSTLNLLAYEYKYHCSIHKEYGEIPKVYCLSGQLNQVFMNLLLNAAHAIENKGDITIRTGRMGGDVWVDVADNGQAIAAEQMSSLFKPCFTTKTVDKVNGLGLAVAHRIVQKHYGKIEVSSEIGKGSVFRIWLPIQQGTPRP